jgi:hypothetical protein
MESFSQSKTAHLSKKANVPGRTDFFNGREAMVSGTAGGQLSLLQTFWHE